MLVELDPHHLLALGQDGSRELEKDLALLVNPVASRLLESGTPELELDPRRHCTHEVQVPRGVSASRVELDRAPSDQNGHGFPFLLVEEPLEPLREGRGSSCTRRESKGLVEVCAHKKCIVSGSTEKREPGAPVRRDAAPPLSRES